MTTVQPVGTDTLSADNHALMHRVFANDSAAPVKSVEVDASGSVFAGGIISSVIAAFFAPRMTTTQKNALTPVEGMEVYDLTLHAKCFYNGSAWKTVSAA